jgi:hypothetical protein
VLEFSRWRNPPATGSPLFVANGSSQQPEHRTPNGGSRAFSLPNERQSSYEATTHPADNRDDPPDDKPTEQDRYKVNCQNDRYALCEMIVRFAAMELARVPHALVIFVLYRFPSAFPRGYFVGYVGFVSNKLTAHAHHSAAVRERRHVEVRDPAVLGHEQGQAKTQKPNHRHNDADTTPALPPTSRHVPSPSVPGAFLALRGMVVFSWPHYHRRTMAWCAEAISAREMFAMERTPNMRIGELIRALANNTHAATAIVASAKIESALEDLICAHMPRLSKDKRGKLFRNLSNWAVIEMAYGMGEVNEDLRHDLQVLRELRNEFSHTPVLLHFGDERIMHHLKRFRHYDAKQDALTFFEWKMDDCWTRLQERLERATMLRVVRRMDDPGEKQD